MTPLVRNCATVALLLATPLAYAGPPPATPVLAASPHLHAARTPRPPVLDGSIDDDVWKLATPSGNFTQRVPNDGAPPSDPTTVRVIYDDDAVYVAFDCPQPHSPITRHLTRRDRMVEVDAVQFDLGTRADRASSFEFYVNVSGTLADAIRFNDTDYSADWDENWEAKTHIGPKGWTAEFRIPLRILRFPSRAVQAWDFQASRYISSKQENDDWAYVPRSTAGGGAASSAASREAITRTPGAQVRVSFVRPDHPIAYGYAPSTYVFRSNFALYSAPRRWLRMAYCQTCLDGPIDARGVVLQWGDPENPAPFLVSGQVWGEDNIVGRPAIFDMPVGLGHVVAFNFNPLYRDSNRGDQRMLWNTIINWQAILAPPVSPAP